MKKFAVLVSLLLGCVASPPPPPQIPESNIAHVLDATVALVTELGLPYCTGSFVRDAVVTAAHCIDDPPAGSEHTTVLVATRGDFVENVALESHQMVAVLVDTDHDVALLVGAVPSPHAGLVVAREAPEYGQRVVLVGHPHGLVFTMAPGRVVHPRRVGNFLFSDGYIWVQSDAHGGPGSSGGPLVNRYGELVGIHSGRYGAYAVHAHLESVKALLRGAGMEH